MAKQPHVLVLMADQMRFDCLSAYGNLPVKTPHMDALADESVVFDRAYCATPLCVPTRTAIAAGKWPHRTGVIVNGSLSPAERPYSVLHRDHKTYYEQLAAAGYALTKVGVQHVRSEPKIEDRVPTGKFIGEEAWVQYLRAKGLKEPHYDEERRPCIEFVNGEMSLKGFFPPTYVRETEFGADDFLDVYWSRIMSQQIQNADLANPHAWVFNLWAPHPPLWVPEPYLSMYDPAAIPLPANVGNWYPGQPPFLLSTPQAQAAYLKHDGWRKTWAAYFGLVTMVDDCMGRVIQTLKNRGAWDDTLVIFTMDHGDHLGAHCLSGKNTMYEESARIPLFIKPPRQQPPGPGSRRKQIANHVDLAATICDYANAAPPPGHQGRSLKPALDNASAAWPDATFAEYHGGQGRAFPSRAVFTDRYKYIFHFCGPDELYDIIADPLETKSLAADPAFATTKAVLREKLSAWMKSTGDVMDLEKDANFSPKDWPQVGPRFLR